MRALRDSQKFYGGHLNALPPVDELSTATFPRLPFRRTAIELEVGEGVLIAVCVEVAVGERLVTQCTAYLLDSHMLDHGWLDFGTIIIDAAEPNITVELLRELSVESDEAKDAIKDYCFKCALAVSRFLAVLNCVNVITEDVPSPAALNKKRVANRKPPIYSYKVLVLKAAVARNARLGGTHESPRIHLRRGHIKRRKTGNFWWQPCVVGDRKRGVVMKDYRADALAA